jgi:DNA modification methylase
MVNGEKMKATLYLGDCLRVLPTLDDCSVDAVVTDPPYSSGGMMRSDRMPATSKKYVQTQTKVKRPEFLGDNRDQRGFFQWSAQWMTDIFRVLAPGGVLMCFTDWRQFPTTSDAIQFAGFVWGGVAVWDKTEAARPLRGWFRSQAEFVLLARRGPCGGMVRDDMYQPGVFREGVLSQEKVHITGKPLPLMKRLLELFRPGSVILDPFMGSGTTLMACAEMGMESIGIEQSPEYYEIARARIAEAGAVVVENGT